MLGARAVTCLGTGVKVTFPIRDMKLELGSLSKAGSVLQD